MERKTTLADDEHIVEDSPQMRSVAMLSGPPVSLQRPSPMGFSMKSTSSTSPYLSKGAPATPIKKPSVTATPWKVSSVQPLPMVYFLERTHITVADTAPQEIATRMADSIRRESMAATYNDREASAKVHTSCGVSFTIRLWMAEDDRCVIVEVQRSKGCGFTFREAAKAVLRAAKGMKPVSITSARRFPMPACLPVQSEDERGQCMLEGVEVAKNLLRSDRLDAQLMAVESLVHLTTVSKCPVFTADCILCGDVLRSVLSLIVSSSLDSDSAASKRNQTEIEVENKSLMHCQALSVLANALETMDQAGTLGTLMGKMEELRADTLLDALVTDVHNAPEKPHEACRAVRCLDMLACSSNTLRAKVCTHHRLQGALATASVCRHVQLEDASNQLQRVVGL